MILCFGLAELTRLYVGYAVVALLVEVNSVFLHTRQLLIIQGFSRAHSSYRLNSLVNVGKRVCFIIYFAQCNVAVLCEMYQLIDKCHLRIILGTFLIFRILTLGWITRWLVVHRDKVPFFAYTTGSIGIKLKEFLKFIYLLTLSFFLS